MTRGNPAPPAGHDRGKDNAPAKTAKPREDPPDQALEDSFPASDPPAQVSKGTISNPKPHEKHGENRKPSGAGNHSGRPKS
jgi:hypothetical protein